MGKKIFYILTFSVCLSQVEVQSSGLLKNIILPGWGYSEQSEFKKQKKTYLFREMVLWSTLFLSGKTSDIFQSNYTSFSSNHAYANVSNHNFEYSLNVGRYNSIYLYNNAMLQQRNPDAVYPENDLYSWDWDSNNNRLRYKKMIQTSLDFDKVKDFTFAGLIIHRIISGINYMYYIKKGNESNFSSMVLTPDQHTVQINFQYNLY
tara:strand:- start:340 stop:954 length:615 start_codon:yes stop_codon:yes gene_type:complete